LEQRGCADVSWKVRFEKRDTSRENKRRQLDASIIPTSKGVTGNWTKPRAVSMNLGEDIILPNMISRLGSCLGGELDSFARMMKEFKGSDQI